MKRLRRMVLVVGALLGLAILLVVIGANMPRPTAPAAPAEDALLYADGTTRLDLRFPCGAETCAGWLFLPPASSEPPVVVMGHGFAGTRDVGLEPFARTFAARGIAAFVFDYRGFGASGGGPRQLIDPWRQLEDWSSAIAFMRAQHDVDGARLALWGSSLGGGHAIIAGARDGKIVAVVAQAPLVDTTIEGEAAAIDAGAGLRLLVLAWADLVRAIGSDDALTIPAMAPPGELGMISDEAAYQASIRLVSPGSSYRNAVAARSILTFDDYDPAVQGADLDAPLLLIASRADRFAAFAGAETYAASHPNARIEEVGGDHFDIYSPPWRDEAAALAADFLANEFAPEPIPSPDAPDARAATRRGSPPSAGN